MQRKVPEAEGKRLWKGFSKFLDKAAWNKHCKHRVYKHIMHVSAQST
jgi:hypothetical protein